MESIIIGGGLRFCQALLQAAPTILVGLVVAAVFRRLLGHESLRRLFGVGTRFSLLKAWGVGMLLPVCSLGVIPVAREMRKAGISGGTILAFALTAPLFNPLSLLYGLTLSSPAVILTFAFCSLVIVTVVGVAWDWMFPGTAAAEPEPPAVDFGLKRVAATGLFAMRELATPTTLYILFGLLGVAALALILPKNYLQMAAEPNDPFSPLFMAAVAIPAYATPMVAMVQLASMFTHGNSIGAAFSLLALGAGANLGLIAWMVRSYGVGRTSAWFAILFGVVVGLAYGVDKPLYPHDIEAAGHTHAFDMYCAPYRLDKKNALQASINELRDNTVAHEIVAISTLGALLAFGLLLAVFDPNRRIESWLERRAEKQGRMDVILPGPALGVIALLGLVALSIFGCYVYYPPPSEILEEMRIVNNEVVAAASSKDQDTALYWIPIYDDWIRKLQVSMFLRGEDLTPYRRAKANVLIEKIELLEHDVEAGRFEHAREKGLEVYTAYLRMSEAFRTEPETGNGDSGA